MDRGHNLVSEEFDAKVRTETSANLSTVCDIVEIFRGDTCEITVYSLSLSCAAQIYA